MSERSFSQERPIVVAHRGAPLVEPENTIASFEAAVAAGADAVEFDVRLSADGVPVILHDAAVDRTTDGHGLARDHTIEELARLTIARAGGDVTGVPTLEAALAALSGRVGVDIELKQLPGEADFEPEVDRLVGATLRTIDAVSFAGPVLLTSFNPFSIDAARRLAPDIPVGLLDRSVGRGRRGVGVRPGARLRVDAAAPPKGPRGGKVVRLARSRRRTAGWAPGTRTTPPRHEP